VAGRRDALLGGVAVLIAVVLSSTAYAANTWQVPEALTAEGMDAGSLAALAANDEGETIALWDQWTGDPATRGVWATYRDAAGKWLEPERIITESAIDGSGARDRADAVVAPDGTATVTWLPCEDCGVKLAQRAPDGQWSDVETLDRGVDWALDLDEPRLALDPDGSVIAVWSRWNYGRRQELIRTSTLTNGTWSVPETISAAVDPDPTTEYHARYAPNVAVDEQGRALVVWTENFEDQVTDSQTLRVVVRPRAADGSWGPREMLAETAAGRSPDLADMAMDEDGVATIAWSVLNADGANAEDVVAVRRAPDGTVSPPVPVQEEPLAANDWRGPARVAVTPEGDATIAWVHRDPPTAGGDAASLLMRTWDADGSWGPQAAAVSAPDHTLTLEDLAVGDDDTAGVTWQDSAAGDFPFLRLREPGGFLQAPETLDVAGATNGGSPRIAIEADGNAVAAWTAGTPSTSWVAAAATRAPADTESPTVTITRPAIGERFEVDEVVVAQYECTDDTDPAPACEVIAPLDTSTPTGGTARMFTVKATDAAGHETTTSHGYFVDAADAPPTGEPPIIGDPFDMGISGEMLAKAIASSPLGVFLDLDERGVSLSFDVEQPNTTIAAGLIGSQSGSGLNKPPSLQKVANQGSSVVSTYGSGLLPGGGSGLVANSQGMILSTYGSGLGGWSPGANIISDCAICRAVHARATGASAKAKPKLVAVATGGRKFAQPGKGKVKLKLNRKGRKAMTRKLGRRGRQTVKLVMAVTVARPGTPAITFLRPYPVRG
jgi:hypothetical protein